MSRTQLLVGPFNRVEGDLEIRLEVEAGRVAAAYTNSPLFRGFERILLGRPALDALTITPRICGICSISQSVAAAAALADAGGHSPAPQGARVTALLHAVENLADHITHFTLFFMPDFARPAYAGQAWHDSVAQRFTAQSGAAIRAATAARAQLLHIVGLLAGKWPHTLAVQPGGVTRAPTARDKARITADLRSFRRYLEGDLFGAGVEAFAALDSLRALENWQTGDAGLFLRIARDLGLEGAGLGPRRYLSFGAYPGPEGHGFARGVWEAGQVTPLDPAQITEDLSHAWMTGPAAHPAQGETVVDDTMSAPGYSWCKAPRLAGRSMETGALARQAIDGHPLAQALATEGSVRARVAARLLEIARTQILLERIVQDIDPAQPFMAEAPPLRDGTGAGLVEAARGALGHWLTVEDGRIARYQIIAPTTWNFSPRDSTGTPGPVEAALEGAAVREGEETPLSVQHIVRSFDPCMVCTVH